MLTIFMKLKENIDNSRQTPSSLYTNMYSAISLLLKLILFV